VVRGKVHQKPINFLFHYRQSFVYKVAGHCIAPNYSSGNSYLTKWWKPPKKSAIMAGFDAPKRFKAHRRRKTSGQFLKVF
jgi:hypothetical protein